MKNDNLQNLRYKLQKRVRRINSLDWRAFHFGLRRFMKYVTSNPVFSGVIDHLVASSPNSEADAMRIINGEELLGDDETEEATLGYWVLKKCSMEENDMLEVNIGRTFCSENKHNDCLNFFRDTFLDPFYEYLDEHIDDNRVILSVLRSYKHRCEWFHRKRLFELYDEGKEHRKAEKKLAFDLYEFLFLQGIDFSIEPSSASGEADLVNAQDAEDRLIADVKIFDNESKGKPYIISGFHQVHTYTRDYNQPFGYLVIFKTCERGLNISGSEQEQSIPMISMGGKNIFLLIIDIYQYEKTASQRGKLETIHLSPSDFYNVS